MLKGQHFLRAVFHRCGYSTSSNSSAFSFTGRDSPMQFDDFYSTIGVFGRYQKVKYFLICITYMFPPIMVYSWSFSAATPSFRCRTPLENSSRLLIPENILRQFQPSESQCRQYQKQISLSECQRCFQVDPRNLTHEEPLTPCKSFVFDRTFYQSTLVEEV